MPDSRDSGGYSLFELLITLALAALVFALGLPSFASLAADKRLRSEADALFHSIHLARKASVVRRRVITICASRDGVSCGPAADWAVGWMMFENLGRTGVDVRSAGEKILKTHAIQQDVRLRANRAAFSFRSTHQRATNGSIAICDAGDRAASRAVVVSYTGRPRVARHDYRGNPYRCAH